MADALIDEDGREYKICALDECGKRFYKKQKESRWKTRVYCGGVCSRQVNRGKLKTPEAADPGRRTPTGFVNPDGVWRPPGFPMFPGGIAS